MAGTGCIGHVAPCMSLGLACWAAWAARTVPFHKSVLCVSECALACQQTYPRSPLRVSVTGAMVPETALRLGDDAEAEASPQVTHHRALRVSATGMMVAETALHLGEEAASDGRSQTNF